MKRSLAIICILLFSTQLFCQIQKNRTLLTGTVRYTKSGDLDAAYEIGLSGGYFIGEKSMVGVSLGIGKNSFDAVDVALYGFSDYKSVSVFSRHYVSLGDESKFYFFVQPAFAFARINGEIYDGYEFEVDSKVLSVSPGFSFYPVSWLGMELSLAGLSYSIADSNEGDTVSLDLNPLNPTLGITFLLGGH